MAVSKLIFLVSIMSYIPEPTAAGFAPQSGVELKAVIKSCIEPLPTAEPGQLSEDDYKSLLIERNFSITDPVAQIRLYQDPSGVLGSGHGATIWDSALVLADYLQHGMRKYFEQHKSVLELGAGCGLAGIVASVLGAQVTLTDVEQVLPLLNLNVKRNEPLFSTQPVVRQLNWSRPQVMHSWGSEPSSSFDLVIGADITYYLETLSALATVIDMASSSHTLVLLAHEHREVDIDRKIEAAFAKIQRKLVRIPREQLGPTYNGGDDLTLFKLVSMRGPEASPSPVLHPVSPSACSSPSASTPGYSQLLRDKLIDTIRGRPNGTVEEVELLSMSLAELCKLADH